MTRFLIIRNFFFHFIVPSHVWHQWKALLVLYWMVALFWLHQVQNSNKSKQKADWLMGQRTRCIVQSEVPWRNCLNRFQRNSTDLASAKTTKRTSSLRTDVQISKKGALVIVYVYWASMRWASSSSLFVHRSGAGTGVGKPSGIPW